MRRDWDEETFWANHAALLEEYTAAAGGDDDRLRLIKEAVSALTLGERTLLVAYAESGSLRATARLFGFRSPDAIMHRLAKIRQKINDYVDNHR